MGGPRGRRRARRSWSVWCWHRYPARPPAATRATGTATGSYWIIARADADAVVSDTEEVIKSPPPPPPGLELSLPRCPRRTPAKAWPSPWATPTRNQGGGVVPSPAFQPVGFPSTRATRRWVDGRANTGSGPTAATSWWAPPPGPVSCSPADADGGVVLGETTETNNVSSTFLVGGLLASPVFTARRHRGGRAAPMASHTTTTKGRLAAHGGSTCGHAGDTGARLPCRAVARCGAGHSPPPCWGRSGWATPGRVPGT